MDTKKLRQKILDLAIRGRLVPQDPNDEPASVLLERIRAEKERLIKEGKIKRSKKSASDTPHYENEVLFEVPESWECCHVSDIFELNPKNNVPDDTQSGFIPMACVDDGFGYAHSFETRPWGEIRKGYSHFQNGDIGIAKISPCFENRKSTIFYDLPNGIGAGTTELTVLRGHCVNIEFYLYLFQSEWYIFEGTKEFKGVVGQQRVNKEIFTTLLIPLPPIEEQNRIVTEIKKWFSLIDTLETAKEDLQESIAQAKSKILDLAIHGRLVPQDLNDEPAIDLLKRINPKFAPCDNAHYPFDVPHNWVWARGVDIFKPMKAASPLGDTFKYIDIDAIDNKRNVVTSVKVLNTKQAPSRASRYTEKGCVLFSMVRPYLRNIAMVTEDDCIASTGFFVCQGKGCLSSKFCYFQMLSNYVVDGLNDFMKGDNSPSITKAQIEEYIFPLPPLNEQERIVTKIEELFAVLDEIQKSIEA